MESKKLPIGAKIIGWILLVLGLLIILGAIGNAISNFDSFSGNFSDIAGKFILVISVLSFITGLLLIFNKRLGKYLAIIYGLANIVQMGYHLFILNFSDNPDYSIVLRFPFSVIILLYFLLNKKVKEF